MNKTQIKCLIVFSTFVVIGFGPVSPTCLIGFFIIAFRPHWFRQLIVALYEGKPYLQSNHQVSEMATKRARRLCFYSLATLFILDILPIPVTAPIAISITLVRPIWLYQLVTNIYGFQLNQAHLIQEGKNVRTS